MADRLNFDDLKLFPPVFAEVLSRPGAHAIDLMRANLVGRPGRRPGTYGYSLRAAIGFLGDCLDCGYDRSDVSEADRASLRASMAEAHAYITAWFRRHGIDTCATTADADAARLGWPDETGKGWRPPYEALGMTVPETAGRPTPGDAERAAESA